MPIEATQTNDLTAIFKTTKGVIRVTLFPEEAPLAVANLVNLAQRGYYDGLKFHRVIANFMIQGGDPLGTGTGGPGYQFADEFSPLRRHDSAGTLSMANSGPRTNGSQFFITHGPTPHLDDVHTVYGKVSSGQDVVDAIAQNDVMSDLGYWEITDRAMLAAAGFHATLPRMNLIHRLIVSHFTGRCGKGVWGRPAPDIADRKWRPPIKKLPEKD